MSSWKSVGCEAIEKYSSTACDKVIAQNIVMVNAGIYALTKLSKVTN